MNTYKNHQRYSNGDRYFSKMVYFVFDLRKEKIKVGICKLLFEYEKSIDFLIF